MENLTKTQRRKSLFASYFVAFIDNFGMGIVFILFAPFFLKPEYGLFHASMSHEMRTILLGIVFSIYPLALFFGAPLFGDVADFYGRKKAFYGTITGTTVGYFLSGLAIFWKSYLFLLISRFITGFFAGNLSICFASIADLSLTERERAKNFGFLSFVLGLSWPIATLIGGYLSDPKLSPYFNPALPFWIMTFLSFLEFVFVYFFFYETHRAYVIKRHFDVRKGLHEILLAFNLPHVRRFFTVLFFWTLGVGATVQWFSAFSLNKFQVSQEAISWGLLTRSLFWSLGGLVINPLLLKSFSTKQIAVIGFIAAVLFTLLCAFANVFWVFVIFCSFAGTGAALSFSNTMNLISLEAPEEIQGRTMGISQSMMSLGWIIVPILGTVLSTVANQLLFPIFALLLFIGLILLLFKEKKERAL